MGEPHIPKGYKTTNFRTEVKDWCLLQDLIRYLAFPHLSYRNNQTFERNRLPSHLHTQTDMYVLESYDTSEVNHPLAPSQQCNPCMKTGLCTNTILTPPSSNPAVGKPIHSMPVFTIQSKRVEGWRLNPGNPCPSLKVISSNSNTKASSVFSLVFFKMCLYLFILFLAHISH